MNIGLIGLGARSGAYVGNITKPQYSAHKLTAVCDCDETRLNNYCNFHFPDAETAPKRFTDYRELLKSGLVDAVIITTPDFAHREIALAAMEQHVHILLEKPIEVNLERVADIYAQGKNYDKTLMMGFELRFLPLYRTIRKLIEDGAVGNIVTVQASERLGTTHAASFQRRWHRFEKNSGGWMNTKCCHDMDILRFVIGSDPRELVAFGDRRVFVPKEGAPVECRDCQYEDTCKYKFDYKDYGSPTNFSCVKNLCPYNSGSELADNEIMLLRFENGVTATFELCPFSGYATRLMVVNGTKAEIKADLTRGTIDLTPLDGETQHIEPEKLEGGHGGGDTLLFDTFIESIEKNLNINNVYDGYIATRMALAGEISRKERKIVTISEI